MARTSVYRFPPNRLVEHNIWDDKLDNRPWGIRVGRVVVPRRSMEKKVEGLGVLEQMVLEVVMVVVVEAQVGRTLPCIA